MRVVFVGPPGCGKSALAASVYSALKCAGRSTELVQEWIRGDIAANGPMISIWEQYRTRQYQKEMEDAVPRNVKYVICDSGSISPYFYACLYSDSNDPRQRVVLQDMYRYLLDDLYLRRYDLIFYLPPIWPADLNDGIRYQTMDEIATLNRHMELLFTKVHDLPEIHRVDSAAEQRLEEVMWKIFAADEPTISPDKLRNNVLSLLKKLKRSQEV